MRRRTYLSAVTAITSVGVSGCLGRDGPHLELTAFDITESVPQGQELQASVVIQNVGNSSVNTEVILEVGDDTASDEPAEIRESERASIDAGTTKTVEFAVLADLEPGTHPASVTAVGTDERLV